MRRCGATEFDREARPVKSKITRGRRVSRALFEIPRSEVALETAENSPETTVTKNTLGIARVSVFISSLELILNFVKLIQVHLFLRR